MERKDLVWERLKVEKTRELEQNTEGKGLERRILRKDPQGGGVR